MSEPSLPTYGWGEAPPGLVTKTQLAAKGLRPGGAPAGRVVWHRGERQALLFAESEAISKISPSPTQLAALAKGREKLRAARYTCPECQQVRDHTPFEGEFGYHCGVCEDAASDRWRAENRAAAVVQAQRWLARPDAVILDTETTHMDGYIVQLAVLGLDDQVLVDELLDPQHPISPSAQAVHGITEEQVRGRLTFTQLLPRLAEVLRGRVVIAYNVDYDSGVLWRELVRSEGPEVAGTWYQDYGVKWRCAMLTYARFVGEWSEYWGNFRYQPLPGAGHRAIDDCRATLRLLRQMAGAP